MTDIIFSVDGKGLVTGSGTVKNGGCVGDHNSIHLTFRLDDGFCPDADYYRLHSEGCMSEELYAVNGEVDYTLPQAMTCCERLPLQLKAYKVGEHEIKVIAHSRIISLCLSSSLDSTQAVDPSAHNTLDVLMGNTKAAADSAKTSADNALLYANRARISADSAESSAAAAQKSMIRSAEISADGHLIITYTDNTTVDAGFVKGEKGDPPQKGVDYWTEADIASLQEYIDGLFNREVSEVLEGEY